MASTSRKVGIIGFVLSAAVACTQLFGGERKNTLAPLPGNQPTFGGGMLNPAPVPGGICATGQYQCNGALLQTCADDLQSWVTVQRCGAAALCQANPATCLAATCAADEMTCAGAVLQKCNADRTGWDLFDTCLSPAHCNANQRQCLPEPCNPGDRRCDRSQSDQSPVLEVCSDDRASWNQLDACVTRELCEQTLTSVGLGGLVVGSDGMLQVEPSSDPSTVVKCNLPACAVGETRCDGARLEYCSEGRTGWITAEECASEALCQASLGNLGSSGEPQCTPPACAAGQHRCSETGVLQVCSEDRSGFRDQEQCIGAPFCNAVLADQGQQGCRDAPCEAGLAQCNGAQIQVCRDDRTALDPVGAPCESAALCNAEDATNAFCEAPLCHRGATSGDEFRCDGAQLQRCNESLTVYDTVQTCVTAALCDASQRQNGCRPPVCQPGQFACNNGFLQTCNEDQTGFDNLENCGSQAQCDANAGRCADPCEPGSTRCNASNGDLERCTDRLTGWQPIADCPNVRLCDAVNNRCNICVPGEFSCADGQLRQCAADGRTFARTNIPPECALDPSTSGGGIRACGPNNQVVINPCPLGCSQNRCNECFQGQTQCVGTGQVRSCVNGFFGAPSNCSDGNFCNGTETCQNNQCVGGAQPNCGAFGCQLNRCNNCSGGQCANGTQFQTCDNGLLSAARNCPAGQQCQGGGNCLFNCAQTNCNDNNSCTNDTCSTTAGCQHSNVANSSQCINGDIQSCTNGVPGTQDCGANGCNPGSTFCNACTANTPATCVNGQRRSCVNGQFQNANCPAGQQCQNGACVNTQICTPNSVLSCTGSTQTVCNAAGTGTATRACGAGQVCSGTACVTPAAPAPVCSAGVLRCTNNALEICNATRTGFTAAPTCVGNTTARLCRNNAVVTQTCGATACRAPLCTAAGCTTVAGPDGGTCTATGITNGTCSNGACVAACQVNGCANDGICNSNGSCFVPR